MPDKADPVGGVAGEHPVPVFHRIDGACQLGFPGQPVAQLRHPVLAGHRDVPALRPEGFHAVHHFRQIFRVRFEGEHDRVDVVFREGPALKRRRERMPDRISDHRVKACFSCDSRILSALHSFSSRILISNDDSIYSGIPSSRLFLFSRMIPLSRTILLHCCLFYRIKSCV